MTLQAVLVVLCAGVASAGCPKLTALPKKSPCCPGNGYTASNTAANRLPDCDDLENDGEYCEGGKSCGTDNDLNNCWHVDGFFADIYVQGDLPEKCRVPFGGAGGSSKPASSGGGGVKVPTGHHFDTPIQIMCIGDSITRGGHGGEMRDPDEHIPVPASVPDTDAEGDKVEIDSKGAKVYHTEFTLEKANYCSKMGIMLDHAEDIDVYNLGVSGATAQSGNALTWKDQEQYDDLMKHYRCDVAIVQLGTNDAKDEYWKDGGANYKKEYKALLEDIGDKCELVLMGLSPPTECKSHDCRFGDPSSTGGLGEDNVCCPDSWKDPDVINVDLPEIQMALAKELGLATIPFREAIGEYHNEVLKHIRSYEQDDPIHPNEYGYWEMAKQACKVVNKALKASFYATDEAATGGKWAAGLAVAAVGGLFAVFAIVSRGKGRRTARVLKESYGAAETDALLPVA